MEKDAVHSYNIQNAHKLLSNLPLPSTRTHDGETKARSYPAGLHIRFMRGNEEILIKALPSYGETKIVTHGGKITFAETTVKEKVE